MKRRNLLGVLACAALVLVACPALPQTQTNRAALEAQAIASVPDNTSQLVTPAGVRNLFLNFAASMPTFVDNPITGVVLGIGVPSALAAQVNTLGGLVSINALSANPSSTVGGQLYYNTVDGSLRAYNGVSGLWQPLTVYTAPTTGAVAQPISEVLEENVYARSFGASGSSTQTSGTCGSGLAANTATLASVSGFVANRHYAAFYGCGATETAATPTSVSATPANAAATTCIYDVSVDDNALGLSAPGTVTITNSAATETTANHNLLTAIPPNSSMATVWWRNCAGAGFSYLGKGWTHYTIAVVGGSGYVHGASGTYYAWAAAGGGCTVEPAGSLFVNSSGVIASARVEWQTAGQGCTSNPTVALSVPGGTGGSLTLALVSTADDNGVYESKPDYVPSTPPGAAQNDAAVFLITGIAGNVVTVNGTFANAGSGIVRHDDTAAIVAGIAALPAWPFRLAELNLDCGTFNVEASQINITSSNSAIVGQGQCTLISVYGNGVGVNITNSSSAISQDGVQHVRMDMFDSTGGPAIRFYHTTLSWLVDVTCDRAWACYEALAVNDIHRVDIRNYNSQGYGGHTFDDESVFASSLVTTDIDIYSNELATGITTTTSEGGTSRVGWEINGVPTMNVTPDCGVSSVEGVGIRFDYTSGNSSSANQFEKFHCDSEFARSDELQVNACVSVCSNDGSFNGSVFGLEIDVPNAGTSWHETGGKANGSYSQGVYFNGSDDILTNTTVRDGSNAGNGLYAGVEIGGSAVGWVVNNNVIGDAAQSSAQSSPILIDSGATQGTFCGNSFGGSALNTTVNNSGNATNVGCPNAGDTGAAPTLTTGACSGSSWSGGPTMTGFPVAGKFTAALCAASTYIISGLPIAAHGQACSMTDQTTPADTLKPTANTVSSATFTGTTAASDVILVQCSGF